MKPNFIILSIIIWSVAAMWLQRTYHNEVMEKLPDPIETDYVLELDMADDSTYIIRISDDGEWWNIIHPDSLEEFIIKDNL